MKHNSTSLRGRRSGGPSSPEAISYKSKLVCLGGEFIYE